MQKSTNTTDKTIATLQVHCSSKSCWTIWELTHGRLLGYICFAVQIHFFLIRDFMHNCLGTLKTTICTGLIAHMNTTKVWQLNRCAVWPELSWLWATSIVQWAGLKNRYLTTPNSPLAWRFCANIVHLFVFLTAISVSLSLSLFLSLSLHFMEVKIKLRETMVIWRPPKGPENGHRAEIAE